MAHVSGSSPFVPFHGSAATRTTEHRSCAIAACSPLDILLSTINQALTIAGGLSADDRARGLTWLQEHAEDVLDFEALAEHEQSGR